MPALTLETDYLIIGAGAVGLAFADTLVSETDAKVLIVDQRQRPGGHWNDAYPFVRLHQPSAFYGVNSLALGQNTLDESGLNQGLYELATGAQVCSYFEQVMQKHLLPSKQVQYFPMCRYTGDNQFESQLTGEQFHVRVNKKRVDTSWSDTAVPATHKPKYSIAPTVTCVPINGLAQIKQPYDQYVIIGAGKTGIDACLWLLDHRVAPDKIRWIMPRDAWLLDRAALQPGNEFFTQRNSAYAQQMELVNQAESSEHLLELLGEHEQLLRIDDTVKPTMYHCATVSRAELVQLKRVKDIVRMGRVLQLEQDKIVLAQGEVPASPNTLYVDCSAYGLAVKPPKPVFAGNTITPQIIRQCQPTFSAALIAHIETHYQDEEQKNALTRVIPYPNTHIDWLRCMLGSMQNQHNWGQHKDLKAWLKRSRLFLSRGKSDEQEMSEEQQAIMQRIHDNVKPAIGKLKGFLAELKV